MYRRVLSEYNQCNIPFEIIYSSTTEYNKDHINSNELFLDEFICQKKKKYTY